MARVAERMLAVMRDLIERSDGARPALIAQDFPLLSMTQEQVDLLQERVPGVEDAYPLTQIRALLKASATQGVRAGFGRSTAGTPAGR